MRDTLIQLGLKCHKMLQSLMEHVTARQHILHMTRLFHPRHIVSNVADVHLYRAAKTFPVLSHLPKQEFLAGYFTFQVQVFELLREMKPVDVVSVLLGIQDSRKNFVSCAVSALTIPPSNADSERAFLHTGISPQT
ncbi:hypothetical protein PR048_004994 [Dryococelus australis]|uniref:Uncharacterized protein n=1 Tax=Dryococelus australis TaxID=614101 RepID=A0ABQ9I6Z1_9NEOP|nr:hypothetical protein PR048_004994 [Dryococelus australis]